MRENRTPGSVQGALGNQRSYCDVVKMKSIIERKVFLFLCISMIAIGIGYVASISDEPRMADGALEIHEASIFELAIIMLIPLSSFAMWLAAIMHSYKSGKKGWLILNALMWPASFIYAAMVNFVWGD